MNRPTISVAPLKWTQVMKFLFLRQAIESETDHLALDGDERKREPVWLAAGRMFVNRRWLQILVAKDGDRFVGYLSIFFARFRKMKTNAYLVLSVREGYRGQGIGTRLMQEAEKLARERGIRRLELEVFAKNKQAYGLFKRLGYEEEGRKRQAVRVRDEFIDLVLMAKFLTKT
ncbi:MAG: GNAT family N-acetyltransferase [Patescibacteria group bacterium]